MKRTTHGQSENLFKGAEPGQPPSFNYRYLYYITHVDNIPSILENGVLSHELILSKSIKFSPIYNKEIVNRRENRKTPDDKSLWHYSNFYLQPRNAMMYQVKRNIGTDKIAVLACFRGAAYDTDGAFITDGNAASEATNFFPISQHNKVFKELSDVDGLEYWKEEDGSKRKMMAEILVPDSFSAENIHSILVSNKSSKDKVEAMIQTSKIKPKVIVDPKTFFEPDYFVPLTDYITLVKGDMFFSGFQTLTVSVNTKGVMGKGLASRAKYQFPDVYVNYQDACKSGKLKLGKPVIYKREVPMDIQLAEDPNQLDVLNNRTWFLLFATKDDWRNPASKEGIVNGLEWLLKNYEKEGITSIAMPALGCGLGWLEWSEMGPILCQYLSKMRIPVQIYLPAERPVPEDQLTTSFLLGNVQ